MLDESRWSRLVTPEPASDPIDQMSPAEFQALEAISIELQHLTPYFMVDKAEFDSAYPGKSLSEFITDNHRVAARRDPVMFRKKVLEKMDKMEVDKELDSSWGDVHDALKTIVESESSTAGPQTDQ